MKKIHKFIIHLLTTHLLICTNQIQNASLSSSTILTSSSILNDSQLNARFLPTDQLKFILNYEINSDESSQLNQPAKQTKKQQIIDQSIIGQTINQLTKQHRNCGVQQLTTGRSPLSLINERNLAIAKLRKKDSINDHRYHLTNENRPSNYEHHLTMNQNRKKNTRRVGKVVGGELAYDGEFPWTVSIRKFDQHHCGGVIISESYDFNR